LWWWLKEFSVVGVDLLLFQGAIEKITAEKSNIHCEKLVDLIYNQKIVNLLIQKVNHAFAFLMATFITPSTIC
jgi:hypothetical protein